MRECAHCGGSLEGMRSHAKYCSKRCKNNAAHVRIYWRGKQSDKQVDVPPRRQKKTRPPTEAEKATRKSAFRDRYASDPELRERLKAAARRQYYKKQEENQIYSRNYRAANKSTRRAQAERRKALVAASGPIPITPREWRRLKARYRGCCAYCAQPCESLQMDHVIPLAKGGRHAPANILPACPSCNISKRDNLLSVWRARQRKEVSPSHESKNYIRCQQLVADYPRADLEY